MSPLRFKTPETKKQNLKLKQELSELIAKNLRRIRRSRDLTQQELAERAGLHLTYYGHLELAKYHPSTFTIWKIAQALEVKIDEIVS